jgi:hypothetical protein
MFLYIYDFYPELSRKQVKAFETFLSSPVEHSVLFSDLMLESLLFRDSNVDYLKLHPPSKAFLDFFKSGGNIQKEISDLEIEFKEKLSIIKQSYQEDRNFPIHYKSLAAKELFEKKRDKLKQVEERMKAICNLLQ